MNIQVNIFFKNIGPGEYTPNHEQIKKRCARSIFGSNIRLANNANIVPSDQNYCHNTKEVWNDGPKVNIFNQ